MKEFYINADGVRLHAKLDMPEGAQSCPLALVFHGLTGHMEERHIVAVAEALRGVGVATLRVESYGHGGSDGEFRNHTILKWVNGALAAIDYAKGLDFVERIYMVGHSQGGLLTTIVAGMRPDDLAAIMPLSPGLFIPDSARTGNFLGIPFDPAHVPDELDLFGIALGGDYFRAAQLVHVEECIDRYPGPVLLVQGTADEAVDPQKTVWASDLYADARLVFVEGDNHTYDNHLEEVTEAVRAFAESLA